MSISVPIEELRRASDERGGRAYLLTVTDDARPHAVHLSLAWEGDTLTADVGKRTARNAAARPVSLLYPAARLDEYSLIVDGTAVVDGERVIITPTRAVLHRPAPAPDANAACGHDCVPVLGTSKSN